MRFANEPGITDDSLDYAHCAAPAAVISLNTPMIVRLANSILKLLCPYPLARKSSASAARWNVSMLTSAPVSKLSA